MITIPDPADFFTYKSGKFYFFTDFDRKIISQLLHKVYDEYSKLLDIIENNHTINFLVSSNIVKSIFYTAAIEGNTLTLHESEKIINSHCFSKDNNEDVSIQEILNLKLLYKNLNNHSESNVLITENIIKKFNSIIINNIDCNESIPGSYRNIRVYVCDEKHGGIYKPPVIHEDIKNLMAKFTEFINSDSMLQTDPLLRAAYAHYYLAMIHPFRDGNGRTSRFIESWLLCKSGFHILALLLSEYYYQNIDMYFSVFSETRRQKNMTKFFQFFLSGCMNSINTILNNKSSSCMKIDFYDAYKRHIRDGALLAENKSWANADRLYGLAAECALKALLIKSGISSTENGDISQRKFRKHIDQLWDEYHSFMLYQIYDIPEDNPFQNWKIDQRYIHSDFITKQIVENHICSIEKINKIIKQAELDGVFSNDF